MANQNTGTRSINIPWRGILNMFDPDLEREKRTVVEYEFSNGRKFTADPTRRGAYASEN